MAIKFNFKSFLTTSAKSRITLIIVFLVVVGVGMFFLINYFGGFGSQTSGVKVAAAPGALQSVPGGQLLSPEYHRALVQANEQASKQAQMTGASAVPTILNVGGEFQQTRNCTVMCPSPSAVSTTSIINDLVKSGKLGKQDADQLLGLAKNNVSVAEYADALSSLVKAGKLTPAEARALLEKYKKEHQAQSLQKSADAMDNLIRSGKLSLDDANKLLALEQTGVTPAALSSELNQLVKQGKLSPEAAAELLGQYTAQQVDEAAKEGVFHINQLAKQGGITPEVAKELADMQMKHVSADQYLAHLNALVAQGKLTPLAAKKLAEDYQALRVKTGTADVLNGLAEESAVVASNCVLSVAGKEKLPQSLANDLITVQRKNISLDEYRAVLEKMFEAGKLNKSAVDALSGCYQQYYLAKQETEKLKSLQQGNASVSDYAEELKNAVRAGIISPEKAAELMQEYQVMMTSTSSSIVPTVESNLPSTQDFSRLRERIQAQSAGQTPQSLSNQAEQFTAVATAAVAANAAADLQRQQERQQHIQKLQSEMAGQAQSLLTAWQPAKMIHVSGQAAAPSASEKMGMKGVQSVTSSSTSVSTSQTGAPLIKSGTIFFGVLETAVDSDYPDTPVMVTIVQGPFKGATLLGKLALAQGQNKLALNFIMMNKDEWLRSKTINAYAIDPDTARTVMASSVDNHYLERYGSLFAASFLSGYANAIQTAGSSSTTGIFGTTTSHPELSPGNRLAVALGQVGSAFSNVVQGYVNTPATVKIDSGVGLGILFVSDVT